MLYTFKSLVFVEGKEDTEGFKSWLVTLNDDKGLPVTIKDGRPDFYIAEAFIDNVFTSQKIDFTLLSDIAIVRALKNATFDCTVIYKKKGVEFTAQVNGGNVNLGTEKTPDWQPAVKGEKYTYQETGVIVDWGKHTHIMFTDSDLDKMEIKIEAAQDRAELQAMRVAAMKAQLEEK